MQINSQQIDLILAEKQMQRTNLAKLSGISKSNLTLILKRGSCTTKNAGKIACGLGVPVKEIAIVPSKDSTHETVNQND